MRQTKPAAQSNQPLNIFYAVVLACCVAAGLFSFLRHEARIAVEQMLAGEQLESPGALATEIFDVTGKKVGEIADKSRYYVGLDMMPPYLLKAFISAEDADFSSHNGISVKAILRAAYANVTSGRIVQGGSTITQQLARLSFLNNDQTMQRKFREALVALTLEATLSKRRILELYLNRIYLGNGSYGVEAAARNYFRKSVSDLNVAESALIAGLAAAPSSYAPHRHWEKAKARQRIVLRRMAEEEYLTEEQRRIWEATNLTVAKTAVKRNTSAPYFVSEIRQQMDRMFELRELAKKGMKIQTTLNLDVQNHVRRQLDRVTKKHFPRAKENADIQSAVLVIDAETGAIVAMQGGTSFAQTKFNHAIRAERPLGSAFMPVYYALALERGFSLLSSLYTQGETVERNGEVGPRSDLSLFEGLVNAKAVESSRLVAWLGAGTVGQQAAEFGLPARTKDLTLALGRNTGSLMKLTGAYAAFANGGYRVSPYAILRVLDSKQKPLFQHRPRRQQVVGKEVSFLIKECLRVSAKSGAAQGARLPNAEVAGFVGTDQSTHDGWYIGVVGPWVVGLWVGSDRGKTKLKSTTDELQEAIGMAWADLIGPMAPKPSQGLPPEEVAFTRLKFERYNLGMQSVPFRLRRKVGAF